MIERHIADAVRMARLDTPVVLLHGARQTGKSTLVRALAALDEEGTYFSLDNAVSLATVSRDPDGFIRSLRGRVIIDEVQQVPDLFRAIKVEVDRERTPGRFLLTGSANILLLPKISESLAGRIEILTLWPLSQGELAGVRERFLDDLWELESLGQLPCGQELSRSELIRRMVVGGYPEVVNRPEAARRRAWYGAYLTTVLQRDIRAIADIEGLADLPRLLALLAAQSGGLLNMAELSRQFDLSQPAVKRYLVLLQTAHLYQPLSAWAGNARKRLIKSPRVFLNDTGLQAFLMGWDQERLAEPSTEIGRLLEAFVHQELRKQITWSTTQPAIYYYRTAAGREVDFVLEPRDGRLVGIEVKATTKLTSDDWKGLIDFAEAAGKRFWAGVLLYPGSTLVPLGSKLWAVPLSALFAS